MKVGYDIMLSQRIKELLDEGTLTQIIAQVQSDLEGEWLKTPPEASATRELIYHELHALNRINIKLATVVSDLLMAERRD
jgi:hypothetical protein